MIDPNQNLDLATFDVPEVFVVAGQKSLHTPAGWPPPPLRQKELVLYGGNPGALKEPKGGEVVWPFQSFTWLATDATDTNIVLHIDFANLFWPGHPDEKINENNCAKHIVAAGIARVVYVEPYPSVDRATTSKAHARRPDRPRVRAYATCCRRTRASTIFFA